MDHRILQTAADLRAALHACPEISGQEKRTKALLKAFLQEHTTLDIHDCGEGFYAAHREENAHLPAIALRADYDALPTADGGAAHLCGHDGNSAALCGTALQLEGKTIGRNVFFLFQPAEETGAGAAPCCKLFDLEKVDEIYAAHNTPGYPFGRVLTRKGTYACASRGLVLRFTGKPAHAAYPQNGISPAPAVGQLLCALGELAASEKYSAMTLCTVIGCRMGEKAFGAAAENAEIWLTLRAMRDEDLKLLLLSITQYARDLCARDHLGFETEDVDVFPETHNSDACAEKVLALPDAMEIPEPMRWSEDFGHYLYRCPGAYFGIGAGEDYAPLHTEHYVYPDALLEPTIRSFWGILTQDCAADD